jgi:hypothetical protein
MIKFDFKIFIKIYHMSIVFIKMIIIIIILINYLQKLKEIYYIIPKVL